MLLDRSSLVEFDTHKKLLDKSELYKEFFASHQSDAGNNAHTLCLRFACNLARRHGDEHVPAKDTPAVNGTVKNGDLQKDTSTAGDIQQC